MAKEDETAEFDGPFDGGRGQNEGVVGEVVEGREIGTGSIDPGGEGLFVRRLDEGGDGQLAGGGESGQIDSSVEKFVGERDEKIWRWVGERKTEGLCHVGGEERLSINGDVAALQLLGDAPGRQAGSAPTGIERGFPEGVGIAGVAGREDEGGRHGDAPAPTRISNDGKNRGREGKLAAPGKMITSPSASPITRLYLPMILLIVAAFAWQPLIGNDDFWAHAAIGRWIAEHHRIPNHTLFLWSANQPWIPHAWLMQYLSYQVMKVGGESGGPYLALTLTAVLASLPFLFIWMYYRRHFAPQALIIPMFLLAIWVSSPRFDPRPELFSAGFLTLVYLYFLNLGERRSLSKPATIGLLVMFALWPNLHGAVAYGMVMIWITALADTAQALIKPDPEHPDKKFVAELGLALLATVAVFACNPAGLSYWKVLVPVQSAAFQKIDEWKPFWAWPRLSMSAVVCEAILWLAALGLWAKSREKRWAQLAWLLAMFFFFMKARRNLWLLALTSLVVIVANAAPLGSEGIFAAFRAFSRRIDPNGTDEGDEIPGPMRMMVRVSLLLLLFMSFASPLTEVIPFRAVSKTLPVKRATYVLEHTRGRLLNDYETSAYLEWRFGEKRPLYIDLNNVYPDKLMDEYMSITQMDKGYMGLIDKYGVQTISFRPRMLKDESLPLLVRKLEKDPHWKQVYKGDDGTVFVRSAR